jgi:hypothetical protein
MDRSPTEAITLAEEGRHNWIVTVGAALMLQDNLEDTTTEVDRKTLARLGRDLVGDGR